MRFIMAKQKSSDAKTPAKAGAAAPAKKRKTNVFEFFQQVRAEASKVTWTTRNETIVSTIMVLIMVTFAAIFFFLTDQVLNWIVQSLLRLAV